MRRPFQFIRGETIQLGIRAKTGTVSGSNFVRAALKSATKDGTVPPESSPELLVLSPSFADNSWLLTGSSDALAPGKYVVDAIFNFSGVKRVARYIEVHILPRVSEPA